MTLPAERYKGPKPRIPTGLLDSTRVAWKRWWSSPMAWMWGPWEWHRVQFLARISDLVDRQLLEGQPSAALLRELRALEDGFGNFGEGPA